MTFTTNVITKTLSLIDHLLTNDEKRRGKKVIFVIIFNMILEIFSIGLIIPLLLILSNEGFSGKLNFLNNFSLKTVIIFLIFFFILKPFLSYFLNFYNNKFKFSLKKSMSERLLEQYIKSNYSILLTRNFDILLKNIITSVSRCAGGTGALIIFFSELLIAIGIIIFLVFINPLALLYSITAISIVGYFYNQIFRSKLRQLGKQIEHYDGQMFSILNYKNVYRSQLGACWLW